MKKALSILLLVALAEFPAPAGAQPVAEDYASFCQFISTRNIFDPSRQAQSHPTLHPPGIQPQQAPPRIVQLVGTMSYEKGMFAFFSGNSEDLSTVLEIGDRIEGYTVTAITANFAALKAADKKERIEMKIGDGLREENSKWVFSKVGELPVEAGAPAESSGAMEGGSPQISSSAPTAPPSATEQNEHLKRLMQQREKENQ